MAPVKRCATCCAVVIVATHEPVFPRASKTSPSLMIGVRGSGTSSHEISPTIQVSQFVVRVIVVGMVRSLDGGSTSGRRGYRV